MQESVPMHKSPILLSGIRLYANGKKAAQQNKHLSEELKQGLSAQLMLTMLGRNA